MGKGGVMLTKRFKWIVIDPKICHGKPVFKGVDDEPFPRTVSLYIFYHCDAVPSVPTSPRGLAFTLIP